MSTDHEPPTPHLFFCGTFKIFGIATFFSSVKIALTALKLMYVDTYKIYLNTLSCWRSVKYNNKDSEQKQLHQRLLSYIEVTQAHIF